MTQQREHWPEHALTPERSKEVMELISNSEKGLTYLDLKALIDLHDHINWRVFRNGIIYMLADAMAEDNHMLLNGLGADDPRGGKMIWELQTAIDFSGLLQENQR